MSGSTDFFYNNDFPEIINDPILLQCHLIAGTFVHNMSKVNCYEYIYMLLV